MFNKSPWGTRFVTTGALVLVLLLALVGCAAPQAAPSSSAPPSSASSSSPSTSASPSSTPSVSTTPTSSASSLTVFAAASLTQAFGELGALYQKQNNGTAAVYNFAGSQQLAQQITNGAPADVFASANNSQMDVAVKSGRIDKATAKTFVTNRLIVIFPKDNPAQVTQLQDLAKDGLHLILADKAVPVGQYALDFLDKAVKDPAYGSDFKDRVIAQVVSYEDNVKSVLSKVVLGEADAGIVYLTDVTGDAKDKVGHLDIPDALNVIAVYPIAPLKDSSLPELTQKFIDLVLSADGQAILAKYGFSPPPQP